MLAIKENIPLSDFTSFHLGGPARFFVEIENKNDLEEALQFAKKEKIDWFILGGGSNLLVSDQGFDGLVIKINNREVKVEGTRIIAGAGLLLSEIVFLARKSNLSGLEWATGIPGTVGGAVIGNAGAYGSSISDSIKKVEVLNSSQEKFFWKDYSVNDCQFAYRTSIFKQKKEKVVFSAVFSLISGQFEEISSKMKKITKERSEKFPSNPSAGSFFKNPQLENPCLDLRKRPFVDPPRLSEIGARRAKILAEFEKDSGMKSRGGLIPAGWLIDCMDLRGKKIGGAMVSMEHSNFIINTGGAKAEDVIILASLIKQKIRNHFGVQLEEEVQFLGF